VSGSAKDLIGEISREAHRQGVQFRLYRNGGKHFIYHLGETVMLTVPRASVNPRSRIEMLKKCEPELGYRWWMPADRRPADRDDIPDGTDVPKGYRGPRRRRRAG
jgi:hypothetical protein